MRPSIPLNSPEIDRTRDDLREAIETSREIVRQSRLLIELSECDPPVIANGDEGEDAN